MDSRPDRSPSQVPVYQTDLAQSPLAEILVTLYRHKAPGSIDCHRGSEVKEIYVDRGHIIFAASNQIRDSLGDKLLRDGRITQEQYDESVRRLIATGKRQGTILTELGVLDQEQLVTAVREQIQEIVWSVFSWDAGTVSFTPGRERHTEFIKLDIPIPQAVLDGVRHMPDAKRLIARLGSKTTIFTRTGKAIEEPLLDGEASRLLELVDGKRSLFDLVNTPPLPAGMNTRILYALLALQLIAVKSGGIKVQLKTQGGEYSK